MTIEALRAEDEKKYLGTISAAGDEIRRLVIKEGKSSGEKAEYYVGRICLSQEEMDAFARAIERSGLLDPDYDISDHIKINTPLYRPKELDHVYRIPIVFSELSNRRAGDDFISRQFAYVIWDDKPGQFEIRDWHDYMLPLEGESFDREELRNIYRIYTGEPEISRTKMPHKAR